MRGSNASWGLFISIDLRHVLGPEQHLATYPLLITNMNVNNFTYLDSKPGLHNSTKRPGVMPHSNLVALRGFETATSYESLR